MELAESDFAGSPTDLTTKISLSFSARNLLDRDVFSKSDPMCVVFLSTGPLRSDIYREHGRTEVIRNCLNPEWCERIDVDYFFEEIQRVKFEVYDIDSRSSELSEHDFLGRVETTLAEIVGAPSCERTFKLSGVRGWKAHGELTVYAEEADGAGKEKVQFVCKGIKLDKKDLFGKSDPFLQIYKSNNGSSAPQLVYRSEVAKKTLNPEWKPFEISMRQLCENDTHRTIRFECYDYDRNGGFRSRLNDIGRFTDKFAISLHDLSRKTTIHCVTLSEKDRLYREQIVLKWLLINEKKRTKKGTKYKDSGRLLFTTVSTYYEYSFLDYIAGGTQLDFFVAIDMTASNGSVSDPESLHFIGMEQPNEYHIAISAVAEICQHYNYTKMFLAAGFGAKLPQQRNASHCFPLNLNTKSYFVHGVQGLLQAYRYCLMNCTLYGPTNFAPVINEAAKRAALHPRNGSRYQILLIITDGCITDFYQTLSAIIAASYLPLSIIIVGVGGTNFENMRRLDSDNELLQYQGRTAQRDIVQFVSLREFLGEKGVTQPISQSVSAMAHLAKEVLAEVPHQLTSYMKLNGINPRPASDPFPVEQPPPPMIASNEYARRTISAAGEQIYAEPGLSSLTYSAPATPSFRPYGRQRRSLPVPETRMPSSVGDIFAKPSTSRAGGEFYPSFYPHIDPAVRFIYPTSVRSAVQSVQSGLPFPTTICPTPHPLFYPGPSTTAATSATPAHSTVWSCADLEFHGTDPTEQGHFTKPRTEPSAPPP